MRYLFLSELQCFYCSFWYSKIFASGNAAQLIHRVVWISCFPDTTFNDSRRNIEYILFSQMTCRIPIYIYIYLVSLEFPVTSQVLEVWSYFFIIDATSNEMLSKTGKYGGWSNFFYFKLSSCKIYGLFFHSYNLFWWFLLLKHFSKTN